MGHQEIQKRLAGALHDLPGRNNIRKISLFGSQVNERARPDSDIDLLIEFVEPIGYFALASLERSFSQALGAHVDLVTPNSISKYFRKDVLREATPLYEG